MPDVRVVDFEAHYAGDFAELNYQWITEYFQIEAEDRKALEHPEEYAILPGGNIFFVLEDLIPVGTAAMVPTDAKVEADELVFELAKMAVDRGKRGKGYGVLLMDRCISFAREQGASEIMLVTNDILLPALSLYERAGFCAVPEYSDARYERGNLEMRLPLNH